MNELRSAHEALIHFGSETAMYYKEILLINDGLMASSITVDCRQLSKIDAE